MSIPQYQDIPIKTPASIDTSKIKGKSVLVTGAGSGLGAEYAKAFAKHGAYVTAVDYNKEAGLAVVKELGSNSQFVQADVTNWDQLVAAFDAATQNSPTKSLDVVIANAGIVGQDDMFELEDPSGPPKKPNLKIMDVNLTGVLYTIKLAFHYFRRQPLDNDRDRCLLLKSSLAGYIDLPGSVQYNCSKFGVRGVFRSLRRTSWKEGIRVNLVAPWYVRTPILTDTVAEYLISKGINFALPEDCAKAMLVFASERSINGRALGVVSRKFNPDGIMDLGLDDYPQGSAFADWQKTVLDTAGILVE